MMTKKLACAIGTMSRHSLTGLGLVLASLSSQQALASWACSMDAQGEWQCAAPTTATGAADYSSAPQSALDREIDAIAHGRPVPQEPVAAPGIADAPTDTAMTGDDDATSASASRTDSEDAPRRHTRLSDDWVRHDQLTPEQLAALSDEQRLEAQFCCGSYVDPMQDKRDLDPQASEIKAHADATDTDLANQLSALSGNVQVSQGNRYLRADRAELKRNSKEIALEGNVVLREPGVLLTGSRADIQLADNTAQVEDVEYLMHREHIHGAAESLSRSDTGVIALTDASYSYCPIDQRDWELRASSLTLDPNDSQGRARHITLRVKNVPVFYAPYMQFPLGDQRMTGFLTPSFAVTDEGVDIRAPYYINLAPNYDLTLTPRLISDHGLMLGAQFRHMSKNTYQTVTATALPGDDDTPNDIDHDRWYFNLQHQGSDKRWASNIDYAAVSDRYYFHDFSTDGLLGANRHQLLRSGNFTWKPDNWNIGIVAKQYQTLDANLIDPHQIKPSLFANADYHFNGFEVRLDNAATEFDHRRNGRFFDIDGDGIDQRDSRFVDINANGIDDRLESPAGREQIDALLLGQRAFYDLENRETLPLTGRRYNIDYSVAYPMLWDAGFIKPKFGVRHIRQHLDDTTAFTPDSNPQASGVYASLDTGLVFERNSEWFGNQYLQTLEPRLFYYYSDGGDQNDIYNFDSDALSFSYAQLFRDYRLSGGDYIDDSNQISVGLTTRLLNPTNGREAFRLSVGQAYYLSERDVILEKTAARAQYESQRDRSALIVDMGAQLSRHWDIRSELLWDDSRGSRERQSLDLRYRDDKGRLFNVGYQFLDQDATPNLLTPFTGKLADRTVEQTYVSAVYPLNNQWSLIGHYNYDITNSRELETIAGVEYSSCCWTARLVARQWVSNKYFFDSVNDQDQKNGVFLQVQFKSLGNVGDNVDTTLADSIIGYDKRHRALD